jgi:hypothetical protein
MKEYKNCKLIFCVASGGAFHKGETYPLYNVDGYHYVALFDVVKRKPILFPLDCYDDDSYKVVGTGDEFEDAEFKEVYF